MLRGTKFTVSYYTAVGTEPIDYPPDGLHDLNLEDIFVYSYRTEYQAWRYTDAHPSPKWEPLFHKQYYEIPGLGRRAFVFNTQNGRPSYVVASTLQRGYGP